MRTVQAEKTGRTSEAVEQPRCAQGVSRVISLLLAGVFFALAAAGAVLPGLPTTPFLLLTSYFLARSSPKWNRLLLRSRFFGPILTDWQNHRGVRRGVKLRAVAFVVLIVALSCYLSPATPTVQGIILAGAGVGIGIIVCLPVVKPK